MDTHSYLVVDLHPYLLCNFERGHEGVRHLIFKGAGIGATAHLDLQVVAINEGCGFIPLQDLVLKGSSLDSAAVRLQTFQSEDSKRVFTLGRALWIGVEPEVGSSPSLMARVDRSQPSQGDDKPTKTSLPAQ